MYIGRRQGVSFFLTGSKFSNMGTICEDGLTSYPEKRRRSAA
jgi:hypothetical protein